MVLNLFRAVAHFKGPQVFVAHFHKNFDVMITMSLEEASDAMAVELISKKRKGRCASSSQVLIRMAAHVAQYFSTLSGMQTHF